jgi:hypothetical protein
MELGRRRESGVRRIGDVQRISNGTMTDGMQHASMNERNAYPESAPSNRTCIYLVLCIYIACITVYYYCVWLSIRGSDTERFIFTN